MDLGQDAGGNQPRGVVLGHRSAGQRHPAPGVSATVRDHRLQMGGRQLRLTGIFHLREAVRLGDEGEKRVGERENMG